MADYKYLVFAGGGSTGIAYSGAIEQLEREPEFSFDQIESVAGASVGALAALMISLKYTPEQASQTLAGINFKKLADGGLLPEEGIHLATRYGIYKGEALYALILSLIEEKTSLLVPKINPATVTFADLQKLGFRDLHVVATKIQEINGAPTGKLKHFSFDKTPDTPVAAVIHASAAAPLFFERVRLKKVAKGHYVLDEDGDLYCDGGVLNDFPIDIFDHPKYLPGTDDNNVSEIINPHTLGLAVRPKSKIINSQHKPVKKRIGDHDPVKAFEGVLNSFLLDFEQEGLNKKKNAKRTIEIDTLGVSPFNFNIDSHTVSALQASGKQAVIEYFHPQPKLTGKTKKHVENNFKGKKPDYGKMWPVQKIEEPDKDSKEKIDRNCDMSSKCVLI